MKRDSMIFYRSFREAIKELPQDEQLTAYDAITGYALDGVEYETPGAVRGIFRVAKPQIDANNQRYINGKKGGRPKKKSIGESELEVLKAKISIDLMQKEAEQG